MFVGRIWTFFVKKNSLKITGKKGMSKRIVQHVILKLKVGTLCFWEKMTVCPLSTEIQDFKWSQTLKNRKNITKKMFYKSNFCSKFWTLCVSFFDNLLFEKYFWDVLEQFWYRHRARTCFSELYWTYQLKPIFFVCGKNLTLFC